MTDLERLLAEKAAADSALAEAEAGLLDDLAAAKEDHRLHPTPGTRAGKVAAAERLRAYRSVVRGGRTQLLVGDTYVSEG